MKEKKQMPETASPHDWRKDMQGATPEKLARALLRPVKKKNLAPPQRPETLK